jgi:hypothetical protein
MSCLLVGQRAAVREQLCNYYATKNATVFQTALEHSQSLQSIEADRQAEAGGLLFHPDPFALLWTDATANLVMFAIVAAVFATHGLGLRTLPTSRPKPSVSRS